MSIDAQTSTCNFIARKRAQTLRTMLSFSAACCADTARHAMLPQILPIRCQSARWTATTQHNPNNGTSFHVSPITFARLPITDLRMDHRIRAHVHGLLCIKSVNWPKFQICINVACWAPSLRATGSVKRYPLCSLEINTSSTTVTMLLHSTSFAPELHNGLAWHCSCQNPSRAMRYARASDPARNSTWWDHCSPPPFHSAVWTDVSVVCFVAHPKSALEIINSKKKSQLVKNTN